MATNFRGKFSGVDTPPLVDVADVGHATGGERSRKRPKVAAWGRCPCHSDIATKRGTQLDRDGAHLYWRNHNYRTYSNTSMPCQASGQRLCDLPAREVLGETPPQCPCKEKK